MIEASCHCGAVRITVASAPDELNECRCSICSRYGVRWAYYSPRNVTVTVPDAGTAVYMWGDRSLVFHRCPDCGCVSHYTNVDPTLDRMAVNARLMPREVQDAARVHQSDGP